MKNLMSLRTCRPFRAVLCSLILAGLGLAPRALAQVTANPPERINYQGYLTDANGAALGLSAPKNYDLVFRIYDASTGGTKLWTEQQTVTVDKGNFSVLLGEGVFIGETRNNLSTLFDSATASDRYLEITVKGITAGVDTILTPRLRLAPAPYAFLAAKATTAVTAGSATNVDGAGIITGTIADARLSANIPKLNSPNTFTAAQTINGTLTAATLGVTGAATVGTTLGVTGATTLTGNTTVGGTLAVTGNTTVGTTLRVTGATTLTGNTTVGGTLAVTGNTTVGTTLGVTGATTLTGNTTVGGTLGVTGATTLTGNTTVGGTLAVTGNTTVGNSTAGVLSAPYQALVNVPYIVLEENVLTKDATAMASVSGLNLRSYNKIATDTHLLCTLKTNVKIAGGIKNSSTTVTGSEFTLKAGTYRCHISVPIHMGHFSKARLYKNTSGAGETLLNGNVTYNNNGSSGDSPSVIVGQFILGDDSSLRVEHFIQYGRSDGLRLGEPYLSSSADWDANDQTVYSVAQFWKVQ